MKSSNVLPLVAVITTIQPPTPAVVELHRRLTALSAKLVVAGDRKGPIVFSMPDCDFLSLAAQQTSGFSLAASLPVDHYARKNIGYLQAIRAGAACIYETDDDNAPLPSWTSRREYLSEPREVFPAAGVPDWINVYRSFSDDLSIWPRGFPLEQLASPVPTVSAGPGVRHAPVQQGLANFAPDVDAIWRLTQDRPFDFDNRPSVWLGPGQWCPFNTQSTWWWPVAYPLLYVPSHCPFRMCDIWKSFVAQRCLWAIGAGVAFHAPEVRQDRNPHDFLKDFCDEIPGYLQNARIATILSRLELDPSSTAVAANLRACYTALVADGIFPAEELLLLSLWIADVHSAT